SGDGAEEQVRYKDSSRSHSSGGRSLRARIAGPGAREDTGMAGTQRASRALPLGDTAPLVYLSLAALLVHLLSNGGYGYFRDELYYIACGEHLDWGYVDQPPLSALMMFLTRKSFGDTLFAIRFLPAVCGALTVCLTGLIARALGGGRFAQVLAAVAAIVAPVYLAIDNFFSMNCFDVVFWALAAYLV